MKQSFRLAVCHLVSFELVREESIWGGGETSVSIWRNLVLLICKNEKQQTTYCGDSENPPLFGCDR